MGIMHALNHELDASPAYGESWFERGQRRAAEKQEAKERYLAALPEIERKFQEQHPTWDFAVSCLPDWQVCRWLPGKRTPRTLKESNAAWRHIEQCDQYLVGIMTLISDDEEKAHAHYLLHIVREDGGWADLPYSNPQRDVLFEKWCAAHDELRAILSKNGFYK